MEKTATGITEQYMLKNTTKKNLVQGDLDEIWSNFVKLKEQSVIITRLLIHATKNDQSMARNCHPNAQQYYVFPGER